MESAFFWMGGRMATDLIAISNDPADIDDGFWAISTSFDGKFVGAKFGKVIDSNWKLPYQPLMNCEWLSTHTENQYTELVQNFREEIAQGNVYQVNACRILQTNSTESIAGLVAGFLAENPARYAGFLKIPGLEIASASPETFLERRGDFLKSSPIKGTRKSGLTGNFPEKDESENIMIVDLMRNDLGRICVEDSISVPNLLAIQELPGLAHLVSDVKGKLRTGVTWQQIFDATLPPGSVSGAPKSSAIKLIKKYEKIDRGPYCGAFGWIQGDQADLAVAIRTFWSDGKTVKFGTGAGITWASDPSAEWEETQLKATRLIAIASGKLT
jgi:para-aminobenzoate synthetase component 1